MKSPLISLLTEFQTRSRLIWLLLASAFVAILDVATVALIFPIFLVIIRPSGSPLPAPFDTFLGPAPPTSVLYALGLTLLAVVVLKNLGMIWVMRVQTREFAEIARKVSTRLLRGYMAAPIAFHLPRTTAQYYRGLRDLPDEVCAAGGLSYVNRFADIAGLLGIAAALAVLEPVGVVLAMLVMGLLAYANNVYLGKRFRLMGEQRGKAMRSVYGQIGQFVPNVKIVKTLGAEPRFERMLGDDFRDLANLNARFRFGQLMLRPISELAMMLIGTIVLVALLWDKSRAIEAVPFVAAFTYAIFRMLPAVTRISGFNNHLKTIEPLIEELGSDLTATEPFLKADAAGDKGPTIRFAKTLELQDVGFQYPGTEARVLNAIDLKIEFGEVIGIAGPSGAGKSTLVDILLGLLDPSEGRVLVDGQAPERLGPGNASVGYVPQSNILMDASARENVAFGEELNEIDEDAVRAAITAANLDDTVARLGGLAAGVGEHGNALSGGQRQRFGIARALYRKPALLVLDEATSDLDTLTEFEISRAINDLRGRTTIVMIAHRLPILKGCDRILYMEDGQIKATGKYAELVENSDGFRLLASMADKYDDD